jgi:hypothetical protein
MDWLAKLKSSIVNLKEVEMEKFASDYPIRCQRKRNMPKSIETNQVLMVVLIKFLPLHSVTSNLLKIHFKTRKPASNSAINPTM